MDTYKAAALCIDIMCPDIYIPNYKEIYTRYYRKSDNPLLVTESSLDAARALFAFAEFDAICFSPFGIEDAAGDFLFSYSYGLLGDLMALITKYQGTGKIRGIHLTSDHQDEVLNVSGYEVKLKIQDTQKPAFGLVVNTVDNEFMVVEKNFKVTFQKTAGNQIIYIGKVTEGRFVNGDGTYHHKLLRAIGREVRIESRYQSKETYIKVKAGEQFVYSPSAIESIITSGIYKIILYQRPK